MLEGMKSILDKGCVGGCTVAGKSSVTHSFSPIFLHTDSNDAAAVCSPPRLYFVLMEEEEFGEMIVS